MTCEKLLALFATMLLLAAVPGISVLAVTTRSAAAGFAQGLYTTAGIVLGDLIYILIAVVVLTLLNDLFAEKFYLLRYAAGLGLVAFGYWYWRQAARSTALPTDEARSRWSSFLSGLLITLADQKAIIFYLGLLPAFIDVDAVTAVDMFGIMMVMIISVGGVKTAYAYVAARAGALINDGGYQTLLNRLAAGLLAGIGGYLILSA